MSLRALQPSLFALSVAEHGGASMTPGGRTPNTGYMVSQFGTERAVPGLPTADDVQSYVTDNPAHGKFVGAWHEGGETYLDRSSNPRSKQVAMKRGEAHAQRAIYDVDRDRAIRLYEAPLMGRQRDNLFSQFTRNERTQMARGNAELRRKKVERKLQDKVLRGGR